MTTIGVGLLAACVVLWQVHTQKQNELELQAENYRNEYRLEVYKEFASEIGRSMTTLGRAQGYGSNAVLALEIAMHARSLGVTQPAPANQRSSEFLAVFQGVSSAGIAVIRLIEKYLIVEPRLEIFKVAVNVALTDIHASFQPLLNVFHRVLPVDIQAEQAMAVMNNRPITAAEMQELRLAADNWASAVSDLGAYLDDLGIELQTALLGTLFKSELPRRTPLDPRHRVVALDTRTISEVRNFFENDTAWGRAAQVAKESVATEVAARNARRSAQGGVLGSQ